MAPSSTAFHTLGAFLFDDAASFDRMVRFAIEGQWLSPSVTLALKRSSNFQENSYD